MEFTHSACPSSVRRCSPVTEFHKRTVSSPLPLASVRPSGENTTELTQSACASIVRRRSPGVSVPYANRVVRTPAHKRESIGRKRHGTRQSPGAPQEPCVAFAVRRSHKRITASLQLPPLASIAPSGENARVVTSPKWPARVSSLSPVRTSHK